MAAVAAHPDVERGTVDQAGDRVKSGTMLDEAIALGSGDIVGLRAVLEATP